VDITNTPLFGVCLHEIVWLAHAIVDACDAVFNEAAVPDTGFTLQVSLKLHTNISVALIASANLRKLVEPSQRRKSETAVSHSFRQRRAKTLRSILDGVPMDELLNSKVRNSLEHFDEYLDEENRRLANGGAPE